MAQQVTLTTKAWRAKLYSQNPCKGGGREPTPHSSFDLYVCACQPTGEDKTTTTIFEPNLKQAFFFF